MNIKTNIHAHFLAAYDSFVNEIFSFFLTQTQEREVAKDLTQETFIKTWREISDEGAETQVPLKSIHSLLKRNARSVIHDLKFAI